MSLCASHVGDDAVLADYGGKKAGVTEYFIHGRAYKNYVAALEHIGDLKGIPVDNAL